MESAAPCKPQTLTPRVSDDVNGEPYQQQEIPTNRWPICELVFYRWSIKKITVEPPLVVAL